MLSTTEERMVPEKSDGRTFWEHLHRYRFAKSYARSKRVLDIACGEGYGTAALAAAGAAKVVGIDVSPETCDHARSRYGIDARVGDAEAIPLPDAEIDTVVSFETIEHLHHPRQFLAECHRVLVPGGKFVISTPNRPVYGIHAANNPFHHHEMTVDEFHAALSEHFTKVSLFGHCVLLPRILRLRGVRRLPTAFRRIFAPHATRAVTEEERRNTQNWLSQPASWRDKFDPYTVRSMPIRQLHRACYLVAVATRGP